MPSGHKSSAFRTCAERPKQWAYPINQIIHCLTSPIEPSAALLPDRNNDRKESWPWGFSKCDWFTWEHSMPLDTKREQIKAKISIWPCVRCLFLISRQKLIAGEEAPKSWCFVGSLRTNTYLIVHNFLNLQKVLSWVTCYLMNSLLAESFVFLHLLFKNLVKSCKPSNE